MNIAVPKCAKIRGGVSGVRRFWLSFVDPDRPKGDRNVGVCIVEPTEDDREVAKLKLRTRFAIDAPTAEQMDIAAALQCANRLGCNPGGEVATIELPADAPEWRLPVGVLLSREDIGR